MPRIAITGHVHLSVETTALVSTSVTEALREFDGEELHGVTCLADGADRIFARAVLALHGTIEVILPAGDYRQCALAAPGAADFAELLGRAQVVHTMPYEVSSREAYLAASEDMLDRCDLLFAVWDGEPSRTLGDTAHVVWTAQHRHVPIRVLWPAGSGRR